MPEVKDERYESITTPSADVARAYRASLETNQSDVSLAVLHHRGGRTEFDLGHHYAQSADPLDRVTGADILAQLGWGADSFRDASVGLLLQLATDEDDRVVSSAFVGLGHRKSDRAIPLLVVRIHDENPDIRLAVVSGLRGQNTPAALAALITLVADVDRDVRNWAAFSLGSGTDADTPELRNALATLLDDEDPEIRGEALIGLAERKDPRTLPALMRELEGDFHGSWCIEAAELLGDPELLPMVLRLRERLPIEDEISFGSDFDRAISALGGPRVL